MVQGNDSRPASLGPAIRTNLVKAALSLLLLGGLTAFLMSHFRPQLDAVTAVTFDHLGLSGVVAVIFVTDAFVSPFPPDSVLILLAASKYHDSWKWLLPTIGLVSACAGYVGYGMGRVISTHDWAETFFGRIRHKSEERIHNYGAWAVALGALTPIPFSITCWTAGLMRVKFSRIIWPCLLRIPRYVLYYLAIAYSAGRF
jgi:membrane protein YqaA with SNARE-associated domain